MRSKSASVLPAIPYCIWPALCVAVIGSVVYVDLIIIHSNILEINRYYIIYIILITASELVINDPLAMHTHWWRTLRDFFTKKVEKVEK